MQILDPFLILIPHHHFVYNAIDQNWNVLTLSIEIIVLAMLDIKKDAYLRAYTYTFIELFAPSLTKKLIDQASANPTDKINFFIWFILKFIFRLFFFDQAF